MAETLVAPAPPPYAVERPHLWRRLDRTLERPLCLVVGPAGCGKTVVLAQWLAQHPQVATVWLTLEPSDNDPVRFARRLLGGLATIDPALTSLITLVSQLGEGLGRPFVEALGTELASFPEVVVVLDDVQLLSSTTLQADVGELVDVLPPSVHLVLASRVDVPMAWARHRLRHDMVELRQADLAFDDAEAAELVERITGLRLAADGVGALVERTEGWAAGLQLAAITLRDQVDPGEFIATFRGHDRLIADYLGEEVLGAQSPERQAFLLRCSVVDELCAELATELTGLGEAQLVLDELERQSMFLVPLDAGRQWFRFHHLFRDVLRFRLRTLDPTLERRLLQQAAEWHLRRGAVGTAIEYRLEAQDWDGALALIMEQGREVFEQGEMATMIRWILTIPAPVRAGRTDVSLLLAVIRMAEGQAALARDGYLLVIADPDSNAGERASARCLLASLTQWEPDPALSVARAEEALHSLAGVDPSVIPAITSITNQPSLETLAMGNLGRAHLLAGDHERARAVLERSLHTLGAAYSLYRISILGSQAVLEAWCGNLERAEAQAQEALSIATEIARLTHPAAAEAYLARALVALRRGQPAGVALALHEGRRRAEANRRPTLMWLASLLRADLHAALGEWDLAEDLLRDVEGSIGTPPPPLVADGVHALRARLLRQAGRVDEAARLLVGAGEGPEVSFERALISLTAGDPGQARKHLERSADLVGSAEPLPVVQRSLIEGWAAVLEGDTRRGARWLEDGLAVAARHGLLEVVVTGGPGLVQVVAEHAPDSPLAGTLAARAGELRRSRPQPTLVDPLTSRELEVLSHLPSRLSNAELAAACFVSVNTVKSHVAHIYRKLGVANRNEAVARAEELGLL